MIWDLTTIKALREMGVARIQGPDFTLEFAHGVYESAPGAGGVGDTLAEEQLREKLMGKMTDQQLAAQLEEWSV